MSGFLHALAIALQVANVGLTVVPTKYQPVVAGVIAIGQWVVHLTMKDPAPAVTKGA